MWNTFKLWNQYGVLYEYYKYGGQRTYISCHCPSRLFFLGASRSPLFAQFNLRQVPSDPILAKICRSFSLLFFYYVWDCSTWGRFSESGGSTPLVSLPFPSIQFMEACSDPILGSSSLLDLLLPTLRSPSPPFSL